MQIQKILEITKKISEHLCSKVFQNFCLQSYLEFFNIFFQKIQIQVHIAWKNLKFYSSFCKFWNTDNKMRFFSKYLCTTAIQDFYLQCFWNFLQLLFCL